jgi:hypothetical protein
MNKNVIAYCVMMFTDMACFAFAAAAFRYARPLADLRLKKVKDPAMRKTVEVLVLLMRAIAVVLMFLSAYLFFRLCRVYGCVLRTMK